jgi:hypothetical protein
MVVPTVPIVLALVARYHGVRLAQREVLTLVRTSLDPSLQRDFGRAKPYQIGNRDGVVNLAYWQEAYVELEVACVRVGRSRTRRFGATAYGAWRGYGRIAVTFVILLVTLLSYLGVIATPSNVLLGLVFGLGAAYLAAIASPPAIAFLWGDRFE